MHIVTAVAERYGVGTDTVLRWINTGQLRAINVGVAAGKKKPRWRITDDALATFEAARTAAPPTPRPARRRRAGKTIEFYS